MVLSPLLVITVIIMEISQQGPEASSLWSPVHLGAGLWSVGLPVVLSLLFADVSWAGEEERALEGKPRAEASRAETGLVTAISCSQRALKSCLLGVGQKNSAAARPSQVDPWLGKEGGPIDGSRSALSPWRP